VKLIPLTIPPIVSIVQAAQLICDAAAQTQDDVTSDFNGIPLTAGPFTRAEQVIAQWESGMAKRIARQPQRISHETQFVVRYDAGGFKNLSAQSSAGRAESELLLAAIRGMPEASNARLVIRETIVTEREA
jgi:hypothetical protein